MKAQLTLTVDIGEPANREWAKRVLLDNLDDLVTKALAEGQITGDTDLEVEAHSRDIVIFE